MVEHLPIERRSAEAEVRRYCAWPTYQLCYAVGRRELLRLREAYREAGRWRLRSPGRSTTRCSAMAGFPVSLARWGMDLARAQARRRPVKITVLTYLDSENENSKEYDPVVPQVARTLRRLGHRVSVLGVHGDVKRLIAGLSRRKPDLVFNLMEMFGDNVFGDIPVTGLLELLGLEYTGSGPGELYLSQDKGLTKKLLAFEDILYPRYAVFSAPGRVRDRRQPSDAAVRQAAPVGRVARHRRQVAGARRGGADGAGGRDPQGAGGLGAGRGVHRRPRVLRGRAGQRAAQGAAADRGGLHRLPRGRAQGAWTARPSGTRGARSTRAPSRSSPTCPTSSARGCRRWRWTPTGRSGSATTAGWISGSPTRATSTCSRSTPAATSRSPASSPWRPAASGLDYPRLIERIVNLAAERFEKKRR